MQDKTIDDVLQDVKEVKENYKEFAKRIVLHLKKVNNENVGVLYGWILANIYTIDIILVKKEYRQMGIAKELLEIAIEEAKEKRCNYVFIYLAPKYLLENTLKRKNFIKVGYFNEYKCFILKVNNKLIEKEND